MLDKDSWSVVLSFCDLPTLLQLARVDHTTRKDVLTATKSRAKALEYIRSSMLSRQTNLRLLCHLRDHQDDRDIAYWLIKCWVNSTDSAIPHLWVLPTVLSDDAEWRVPVDSHLRLHMCPTVMCMCVLPSRIRVKHFRAIDMAIPDFEYARERPVLARIMQMCSYGPKFVLQPTIMYVLGRLLLFGLDAKIWSLLF
jgi:hypothetical protein